MTSIKWWHKIDDISTAKQNLEKHKLLRQNYLNNSNENYLRNLVKRERNLLKKALAT